MRAFTIPLLVASSILLSGCIAKTLVDVATAPVKVVSKGVDLATTSQSEADEKRGREIRRREAELADLKRDYDRQSVRCNEGDAEACAKAEDLRVRIEVLLPSIPVEPASD